MAMIGYVSFNYLDGVVQAFFTCITTSAFSSCRRPLACSPNESCFSHRMTQLPSNTIWLPVTKLAGNRTASFQSDMESIIYKNKRNIPLRN